MHARYLELCGAHFAVWIAKTRLGIFKLKSIGGNLSWLDYSQSCNSSFYCKAKEQCRWHHRIILKSQFWFWIRIFKILRKFPFQIFIDKIQNAIHVVTSQHCSNPGHGSVRARLSNDLDMELPFLKVHTQWKLLNAFTNYISLGQFELARTVILHLSKVIFWKKMLFATPCIVCVLWFQLHFLGSSTDLSVYMW